MRLLLSQWSPNETIACTTTDASLSRVHTSHNLHRTRNSPCSHSRGLRKPQQLGRNRGHHTLLPRIGLRQRPDRGNEPSKRYAISSCESLEIQCPAGSGSQHCALSATATESETAPQDCPTEVQGVAGAFGQSPCEASTAWMVEIRQSGPTSSSLLVTFKAK